MNRIAKWAARAGLGLVGAAAVATGAVYAGSEMVRAKHWPKAAQEVQASRDPGAVARGARLARIYGCHDCHGADLTGRRFHDDGVAVITGANLSLAAPRQSDADLARAIRTGVAADGRGLWVMPSEALATLSDQETGDLIAYLRTFPPRGQPHETVKVGFVGRLGVVLGKFKPAPAILAERPAHALDLGPRHARGRALARACMECHGSALTGGGPLKAPDLTIAASYDLAAFTRLMRTGVAAGERTLPMMSPTARDRFALFSDDEIAALHGYLRARAEKTPYE